MAEGQLVEVENPVFKKKQQQQQPLNENLAYAAYKMVPNKMTPISLANRALSLVVLSPVFFWRGVEGT